MQMEFFGTLSYFLAFLPAFAMLAATWLIFLPCTEDVVRARFPGIGGLSRRFECATHFDIQVTNPI